MRVSSTSINPSRVARAKPFGLIAAVFVLGALAGGGAARAYTLQELRPTLGAPRWQLRLNGMTRALDLDQKQRQAMEGVLRESDEKRDAVLAPCQPAIDAQREEDDAKIREILDDEQRKLFDEGRARRKASR